MNERMEGWIENWAHFARQWPQGCSAKHVAIENMKCMPCRIVLLKVFAHARHIKNHVLQTEIKTTLAQDDWQIWHEMNEDAEGWWEGIGFMDLAAGCRIEPSLRISGPWRQERLEIE